MWLNREHVPRPRPAATAVALTAAALIFFVVSAAPALATPPQAVTIQAATTIPLSGPTFGPFLATGPVCPAGDSLDVSGKGAGFQSNRKLELLIDKLFTCANGSDTFTLRLKVNLTFFPTFSDVFN